MSASNPGPMFMMLVAVVFSFGVAYIAHRGVNGSTAVNIAINVIQISRLDRFFRHGYQLPHEPSAGKRGLAVRFGFRRGLHYEFATSQTVNGQQRM
jgi:hypothetical protein